MRIQINNQGKEFVYYAITKLHEITVVDQRGTYAYHPQANGLCESQNRAIKDSLVKLLNAMLSGWSYVTKGVPFVHRVSRHSSTKYTSFFIMYNQEPVLPINIQHSLNTTNNADEVDYPFNKDIRHNSVHHIIVEITKSPSESRRKHHESSKEAATGLQPAPYLTNVH